MKEDLLGNHYGHLEVIGFNEESRKWICKCDCGENTEVTGYNLRLGNTKSCGCSRNGKGIKKPRKVNIMNERIGQLLVTDVNLVKGLATVRCYQCKRVSKIPIDKVIELKKSRKKSITCGKDGCVYTPKKTSQIRKGTKFGRLIVIERIENRITSSGKTTTSIPMYLCECECGNQVEVQGRYLLDGRTKSCGCLKQKNFVDKNSHGSIVFSPSGKKLYEIFMNWQKKYRQPTKAFKEKVIDKGIKFFPELKDEPDKFKSFYNWALVNDFSKKEGRVYLDRMDYSKDFSVTNCFWSSEKTRGY